MNKNLTVKQKQKYITIFTVLLFVFITFMSIFVYYNFFTSTLTRAKKEGFEVFFTLVFVDEEKKDVYGVFVGVISAENNRVGLISIPRNMGLWHSAKDKNLSVSSIYSRHGKNAVSRAIENTFQIDATYKFIFDNKNIVKTIDLIGGVNMYLEEPISFEDKSNGYNISFNTGEHLFTGEKILAYINHIQDGAYKHRLSLYKLEDVILNIVLGFIDSSILRSISITKGFQKMAGKVIDSNLRPVDYKAFGELTSNLDIGSFRIETLDGQPDKNNVLVPIDNGVYAVRQVRELARVVALKTEVSVVENEDVTMNVLNATDIVGLADRINIRMRYRGFSAVEYGNFAIEIDESVILVRNGEIEKAFLIAKASNVDKIYSVTDRSVLNNSTLVLGSDYYEISE